MATQGSLRKEDSGQMPRSVYGGSPSTVEGPKGLLMQCWKWGKYTLPGSARLPIRIPSSCPCGTQPHRCDNTFLISRPGLEYFPNVTKPWDLLQSQLKNITNILVKVGHQPAPSCCDPRQGGLMVLHQEGKPSSNRKSAIGLTPKNRKAMPT